VNPRVVLSVVLTWRSDADDDPIHALLAAARAVATTA
jgi:hypothetical protein